MKSRSPLEKRLMASKPRTLTDEEAEFLVQIDRARYIKSNYLIHNAKLYLKTKGGWREERK